MIDLAGDAVLVDTVRAEVTALLTCGTVVLQPHQPDRAMMGLHPVNHKRFYRGA